MNFSSTPTTDNYSEYGNLVPGVYAPNIFSNSNVMDFSRVFLPTVYSIVFIVGFIGNGLVLCVLVKYHKPFNMSDLCLFNLAISDLLFLISLPFWADYAANSNWAFPEFMCQAVTALYMLGFYGNIFFMILMTVDRYAVIVHTSTSLILKHRSVRASIALALFVWTLSLGVSLPHIIFSKVNNTLENETKCMLEYSERKVWKSFHYIELNILGFIIPLSVMLFCYSRIIPILMTMQSQKKHKAVRLMVVLVTVFFLFWTPYNIVIFLMFMQELGYMTSRHCYQDLHMAIQWVECIAFCHCCLNPIIYAFVGQKFRNLFLKILKEWFPLCFGHCTTVESKSSERTTSRYSRASMISSTKAKLKV
ncbi:C-C chemokine receptor type 5-like isoform X2 [Neoarius graeffei]|uniref:C-C chemokine receptor type 5-like isoform X2 n=1 Tax=Neoarius graeffei TaxID=443677 RepID=UPI00298BDC18|nr:C-C chemokine receptor type 5-like isoform X2 [Neoarius graeffei]